MMVAAGMLTLALLLHAFSWVVLRASRRHDDHASELCRRAIEQSEETMTAALAAVGDAYLAGWTDAEATR